MEWRRASKERPRQGRYGDASTEVSRKMPNLDRKCRRRHLLTDSNSLGREIDEKSDRSLEPAECREQKRSKPGEGIARASEEPHVGPGIEFVLGGQYADFRRQAAVAELREIRVSLPMHAAEQVPIA